MSTPLGRLQGTQTLLVLTIQLESLTLLFRWKHLHKSLAPTFMFLRSLAYQLLGPLIHSHSRNETIEVSTKFYELTVGDLGLEGFLATSDLTAFPEEFVDMLPM